MKEQSIRRPQSQPPVLRSVRALHSRVVAQKCRGKTMLLWQQDSREDCDSPDDKLKFEHTVPYSYEYCRCCCFPDGMGDFTFEKLTVGATAGRQCCSTLKDAISTWKQNRWRNSSELNLEDARISISPGHIPAGAQHTVDPQIELEWHDESVHLRLFQPEGSSGNVSTYQRD